MLGFSSQTGSKPPGSGSSDPGSQSTGAKDKSPRLPKLFNSGGSVKGEKSSNSHQLRPPGMSKTPSPVVQIQVHLLPGNTNETAAAAVNNIHQQQRPRRHSLERFVSNSCQKPVWAWNDNEQSRLLFGTTSLMKTSLLAITTCCVKHRWRTASHLRMSRLHHQRGRDWTFRWPCRICPANPFRVRRPTAANARRHTVSPTFVQLTISVEGRYHRRI